MLRALGLMCCMRACVGCGNVARVCSLFYACMGGHCLCAMVELSAAACAHWCNSAAVCRCPLISPLFFCYCCAIAVALSLSLWCCCVVANALLLSLCTVVARLSRCRYICALSRLRLVLRACHLSWRSMTVVARPYCRLHCYPA
eukprot:SAG11_NODE_21038_length_433_cov_0.949102_1_plen_144_part_01